MMSLSCRSIWTGAGQVYVSFSLNMHEQQSKKISKGVLKLWCMIIKCCIFYKLIAFLSVWLHNQKYPIFTPQPSGLEGYCRHGPGGRAGGLAGGRAGGCQTCGTHISVTAWWIFSVRSSMELSRPVVVHCHAHLPICSIWACPWAENLSNLPQIGSRLCGSHISETTGWIYPI